MYHSEYGSDEILRRDLKIDAVRVAADNRAVRLIVSGLRELFVHELHVDGVRAETGEPLLHPRAYYTLNRIPRPQTAP